MTLKYSITPSTIICLKLLFLGFAIVFLFHSYKWHHNDSPLLAQVFILKPYAGLVLRSVSELATFLKHFLGVYFYWQCVSDRWHGLLMAFLGPVGLKHLFPSVLKTFNRQLLPLYASIFKGCLENMMLLFRDWIQQKCLTEKGPMFHSPLLPPLSSSHQLPAHSLTVLKSFTFLSGHIQSNLVRTGDLVSQLMVQEVSWCLCSDT